MAFVESKRTRKLKGKLEALVPTDAMPEAGRKILLANLITILGHEAGSRTGEDIEDVHDMRVAIRRTRSAFKLLSDYYTPAVVQDFIRPLRQTARLLGDVRDLDVMISDLTAYQASHHDESVQQIITEIITVLDAHRARARARLIKWLDSKTYKRFVKDYSRFLTTPGQGAIAANAPYQPHQVRHVISVILHQHLASVRAYDALMADITTELMHQLRIEFKQLRYAVSFFSEVLGASASAFIDEIKTMQDYLGRLNDIVTASDVLDDLSELSPEQRETLDNYLSMIEAEAQAHLAEFPAAWENFNKRAVQRKLSDALLILR